MFRYRVCVTAASNEAADELAGELRKNNYDAVVAADAETAVKICGEGGIDLIVLAADLAGAAGLDLWRRLRAEPCTADTVVLYRSAADAADIDQARALIAPGDRVALSCNPAVIMVEIEAALDEKHRADRLRIQQEELLGVTAVESAVTDSLTGLRNRGYLLERLQEEVEKAHRYNFPVSCVIFALDDLEAAGYSADHMDDLLAELALTVRNEARSSDIVARSDYTEFAAVLPHASLEDAITFATRVMREVSETPFMTPEQQIQASLAAGIVTCQNGAALGADFVFGEAMRRLFEARSVSRDRLVASDLSAA